MRLAVPTFLAVTLAAGAAAAHAVLTAPTPRSNSDSIKTDAPCGPVPRGPQPVMTYTEGQQNVQVQFKETIDHQGCFVVSLLRTGDTKLDVISTLEDGVDTIPTGGRAVTMNVNLPAGVACNRCTLQLRQVMSGTRTCDAGTFNASTYYSCSDIRIAYADGGVPPDDTPAGDGGTAGGEDAGGSAGETTGAGSSGGTPGGSGTGAGNGSGGKKDAGSTPAASGEGPEFQAKDAGGCAVQRGAAPAGLAAWAAVAAACFAARRRRRR